MRISTEIEVLDIVKQTEFCSRQESHFFEKKSASINPGSITNHVVAFANSDGGELVIGIHDEKKEPNPENRWNGLPDIEHFNNVFQTISELSPSVDYSAIFLKSAVSQTYALKLDIQKSHYVHVASDGHVYLRNSAQSCKVKDPKKIQAISFEKGEKSFEDSLVVDSNIEDMTESDELRRFLEYCSPSSVPLDFLVKSNLIDRKTFIPRTAGILLFTDSPVDLVPTKCSIKITRFTTASTEPDRDHMSSVLTIEGPLNSLINKAMVEIQKLTKTAKKWTNDGQLEDSIYPFDAIWEVLVNAIIHRDYSIADDVHVLIFNNRIEIKSPGKLPGEVNVNNILKVRFARNPKIERMLSRYENPVNKDVGEGLRTAFQRMREFHLEEPEILEEHGYVNVILSHETLATPSEMVIEYLKTNQTITNRKLRELTGIRSETKALSVLKRLHGNGHIQKVRGLVGKASAWELCD